MSRREQIQMSAAEVANFLAEERTVTCATIGPRGWPHLMPLWYVLRSHSAGEPGPRIWSWTYARSQKVRNIERDPRATLQVETGEAYQELRGVMFECDVIVHREIADVVRLGAEIMMRNSAAASRRRASFRRRRATRSPRRPATASGWSSSSGAARVGTTGSWAASIEPALSAAMRPEPRRRCGAA
jgi:nitroimidazol reductase NimA-like FMN-containing flavoprotein (pyridoxamine 5'-phosphate oxidase superfamily)